MKILIVILLMLLTGCREKIPPVELAKAKMPLRTACDVIKITEKEIDDWNRDYDHGINNEIAEAIAACFYHDHGYNITTRLDDFGKVMEGKSLDQCLLTAQKNYKYKLVNYRRDLIESMLDFYRCRKKLVEYDSLTRIIDCEYDNLIVDRYSDEAAEIWERYRTIGGGNGFYEVNKRRYWQCTTFAWARFYEVYGYDSGAIGDGCFHATEIVREHPDRFKISVFPAPGATFSKWLTETNHAGHTGFVEAVEGEYMGISDGNFDGNGGIRFNYKVKISDFTARYPNTIYAVPTRY